MKKQLLYIASLFVSLLISQNLYSISYTVNTVGNTGFSPSTLTVNVGDTVTFINTGGFHNVNGATSVYPNNPVGFGNVVSNNLWSYEWIFTVPGTYDYQCDPHVQLGMVGVVIVVPSNTNTIYDVVSNSPDHNTLKAAIDACALDATLSGAGPLTLFAPTDAAFNLLPTGTVAGLLADIPTLTDILLHHVVGDDVGSGMLSNGQMVSTLNGDVIVTINSMGEVFIDNAQVIIVDILADNGVVHVIDAVLLPTTTSVSDLNHLDKEYVYSINILGEKINRSLKNQIIFDVYIDGSITKRYVR